MPLHPLKTVLQFPKPTSLEMCDGHTNTHMLTTKKQGKKKHQEIDTHTPVAGLSDSTEALIMVGQEQALRQDR